MEKVSLNLNEVGNKARTKWEMYRLLTVEGHFSYLPTIFELLISYLTSLLDVKRHHFILFSFISLNIDINSRQGYSSNTTSQKWIQNSGHICVFREGLWWLVISSSKVRCKNAQPELADQLV